MFRRPINFGLRTLLIAVAIMAALCAKLTKDWRNECRVGAVVNELSGFYYTDETMVSRACSLVEIDFGRTVSEVYFHHPSWSPQPPPGVDQSYMYFPTQNLNDEGLKKLIQTIEQISSCRKLTLAGTSTTDEALRHVSRLTQLEELNVSGTKLTDAGIIHLTALANLEHLAITDTAISNEGLKSLHALAHLKVVYLRNTNVSPNGIDQIKSAIPGLEVY